MPQYNITATSAEKNQTVSNTVKPVVANPDEPTREVIPFPSPAEFADQAAADANAVKYAKWLIQRNIEHTSDWVGQATAV
jgi:hypothetical protein